jgi:hypothetical protein
MTRPDLMLNAWLKEAQELQRPFGVGDIRKGQSSVGKDRQQYATPNPPMAATQPGTVTAQKTLSPPPV